MEAEQLAALGRGLVVGCHEANYAQSRVGTGRLPSTGDPDVFPTGGPAPTYPQLVTYLQEPDVLESALPTEAATGPGAPGRRRRLWLVLLVVLACLAAAAVVGVVWLRGDDAPSYPAAWDPEVQPFTEIVEKERDLKFEHPVYVDFLSKKDFQKKVTADEKDLTDEDREEIERYTGMFRALGLIEGDVDLFDTVNQLQGSAVIGYYSYDDERIRIRGTKLTPAVQSTLVHELTHALQDQNFDLGKRFDAFGDDDSAAEGAFDALVEGDARRIETAWRQGLAAKDKKALDQAQTRRGNGFDEESTDIPEVLKTLMSSPYVFGEALLKVAMEKGGERAVDDLFRSPPTTEEQQLDPWTLVADHQGYLNVTEPSIEKGEKKFDGGSFGAITWMLVLAERIPVKQALEAADGWGGDSYAAFERDGVSCVKLDYVGDAAHRSRPDAGRPGSVGGPLTQGHRTRAPRRFEADLRVVRRRRGRRPGGDRLLERRGGTGAHPHLPVRDAGALGDGHADRSVQRRPPHSRVHRRRAERTEDRQGAGAAGHRTVS